MVVFSGNLVIVLNIVWVWCLVFYVVGYVLMLSCNLVEGFVCLECY